MGKTSKKDCEDPKRISRLIDRLRREHNQLQAKLSEGGNSDAQVSELKRRKLDRKDRIGRLERTLRQMTRPSAHIIPLHSAAALPQPSISRYAAAG